MNPPKGISLTLTIDTKEQRVLFAQADKAFLDFIFSLLITPMSRSNVGCLPNIHQSIKDLKNDYMVSDKEICFLLNPISSVSFISSLLPPSLVQLPKCPPTEPDKFYRCNGCINITLLSSSYGTKCTVCGHPMSTLHFQNPITPDLFGVGRQGFVKRGVAKYMVMDDLSVTEFDPASVILFLKKMKVKSMDAVEEKLVHIGNNQAQALLELALGSSNRVLTNVFLGEEASKKRVKT